MMVKVRFLKSADVNGVSYPVDTVAYLDEATATRLRDMEIAEWVGMTIDEPEATAASPN